MDADPRIRRLKSLFGAGDTWRLFVAWWVQRIHGRQFFIADDHWVDHVEAARRSPELADFDGKDRVRQAEYIAQKNTGFAEATDRRCQFCFLDELRQDPLIQEVLGYGTTEPEIPEHWIFRQQPREIVDHPAAGSIQAAAQSWARVFLSGREEIDVAFEAWATSEVFDALMLPRPMSFPEIRELIDRVRNGPDDNFYEGAPAGAAPVPVR